MLTIDQYEVHVTASGPSQLSVKSGSKFLKAEAYKGYFVAWYERDDDSISPEYDIEYFKVEEVGSVYLNTGEAWKLACTAFVEGGKALFLFRRTDEKAD